MLIKTEKHTPQDLKHWQKLAIKDTLKKGELQKHVDQALQTIQKIVQTPNLTISVSWGKDSVTAAHIAHTIDPTIPLWWNRSQHKKNRTDNPGCITVRDLYLQKFPQAKYTETHYDTLQQIETKGITITGVRGAESKQRRISQHVHGAVTDNFCRPIINWPTWAVSLYLNQHKLPIHPAYAYTKGGLFERDRIRVHSFGGEDGANHGRHEWEKLYYPKEFTAARQKQ